MERLQKERAEDFSIEGRRRRFPAAVYYVVSVGTLGIFHIICSSFPMTRVRFETAASTIEDADVILYKNKALPVETEVFVDKSMSDIVYEYVKDGVLKYVYIDHQRKIFNWVSQKYEKPEIAAYIDTLTRKEREVFFGTNRMHAKVDSVGIVLFNLLFTEVNVYTLLGILLWICINYLLYALLIFTMMLYVVASEAKQEIKKNRQTKKILKTARPAYLLDQHGTSGQEISSFDVVVGDLLIIVPFLEIPCDCTVLQGTIAVDEGFVTGESVPVLKKEGGEILGGTRVLQALSSGTRPLECPGIANYIETGNYIIARATKTAFASTKGKALINLTEDKVTYPPVYFDTIKMLSTIAALSLPVLGWLWVFLISHGMSFPSALSYVGDLFYSIVSPALPATIWVGISISAKRLNALGIVCKDLFVTNISGHIARVCFDKTGTLTEDGLDVKCVHSQSAEHTEIGQLDAQTSLGIQVCQSVEVLDEKLLGDPLDIKLLEFTKSTIGYHASADGRKRVIKTQAGESIAVHQVFEFNPNTRRMGAIAERNGELFFFCKGSSEAIEELCAAASLPADYKAVVEEYALAGFRVISLAGKQLDALPADGDGLESGLQFLGIIVFENKLKQDTQKTISVLSTSGIDSVMCTGDALLTAVSVATNCGIIEQHAPIVYPILTEKKDIDSLDWKCITDKDVEFDKVVLKLKKGKDYTSYSDFVIAIEGTVLSLLMESPYYQQLLEKRCKVYSRMNPLQKSQVVNMYKNSGLVCFVGDGANDCSAIQSADVGVSLSSAEGKTGEFCVASYVSYIKEISSLLYIIREGKCTSITTINTIEQLLIITVTQFIALSLLQGKMVFLSDAQNIYSDIFVAIPLPIVMSKFRSNTKMTWRLPKKRIILKKEIFRLLTHCCSHLVHLFLLIRSLAGLSLTTTIAPKTPNYLSEQSQITTAVFFLYNFQILFSGFCYASGVPFREPKRSSLLFVSFFLFHTLCLVLLLFSVSTAANSDQVVLKYSREMLNLMPLSRPGVFLILVYCGSDMFIVLLLSKIINVLFRT